MVGAEFGFFAVMENAGSDAEEWPSLTEITIPDHVPGALGVPFSAPLALENCAHAGLCEIEKRNLRAGVSGSVAVGTNEYALPTTTLVGGDPEIEGGEAAKAVAVKETDTTNISRAYSSAAIQRVMNMTTLSRHRHREPSTTAGQNQSCSFVTSVRDRCQQVLISRPHRERRRSTHGGELPFHRLAN